jgi:hypothetical protein
MSTKALVPYFWTDRPDFKPNITRCETRDMLLIFDEITQLPDSYPNLKEIRATVWECESKRIRRFFKANYPHVRLILNEH